MVKLLYILKTPIIAVISLFLYSKKNLLIYFIPKEYEIEFNILLYSSIIELIITTIKCIYSKLQVRFNCFFGKEKIDLKDITSDNTLNYNVNNEYNKLYVEIGCKGFYKQVKKYDLIIQFPFWIDINIPIELMNRVKFSEKKIDEGKFITNLVFDFSKIDTSDNKKLDTYKQIKLEFLLNNDEDIGEKDFIYVSLKKKNRIIPLINKLDMRKLEYNKVQLYKEIN